MVSLIKVCPRPFREIIFTPFAIKRNATREMIASDNGKSWNHAVGSFFGEASQFPSEPMLLSCFRVALAVTGLFSLFLLGSSLTTGVVLGLIASIPATLLVAGSGALLLGISTLITGISINCMATIGIGFAAIAGGLIVLEGHDLLKIGLLEGLSQTLAEKYAHGARRYFLS